MPSILNPLYRYALSPGWNVAVPVNVESFLRYPPTVMNTGMIPPLGGLVRRTLDDNVQINGTISHQWSFSYLTEADFDTLMTRALGNLNTGSANVTIVSKRVGDVYARYNAIVIQPQPAMDNNQGDFRRAPYGGVFDLYLHFQIILSLGDY